MEAPAKLYVLNFSEIKTYLFAILFIGGNILFPQLCHLVPGGGLTWLPIYFFTLIASYKYGWQVGLITAVLSPLVNSLFFGMPVLAALPVILVKSVLLAVSASFMAKATGKVSILGIISAVLLYQFIGILVEWMLVKDFIMAIQDFRIGMPGIFFQVFAGYLLLKVLAKI